MTSDIKVEPSPASIKSDKVEVIDPFKEPPCKLFSITQYQCTPLGGRVTCWSIERIFRQCGQGKPAIEVTNKLKSKKKLDQESLIVDPAFLENPPKARNWNDYRGS
ncbi:uncharacterized protein L201_001666 [Kwoniella dendrophila CBS 6074]|uniref:Uncharacterized protein n=1 Tax=Kwoniella dendrophila CBS 6074 TaxID=1295534 RepID=A0AAX4JPN1_9TREE